MLVKLFSIFFRRADAEELESGSRNLLLERWTELCSILTKKEERPSWKQFVSIYGKVGF